MSQPTKSDSAVTMANALIGLAAQIKNASDSATAFATKNTSLSPDTYWRKMDTVAVKLDGTAGTADTVGTPVLTNPIIAGGINRAEADLLQGLTLVNEFVQFLNGTLPAGRVGVNRLLVLDTLIG